MPDRFVQYHCIDVADLAEVHIVLRFPLKVHSEAD